MKRVHSGDEDNIGQFIPDFVESQLRNDPNYEHGYGHPVRNGIEYRLQRTNEAIGRLLEVLTTRGLLTDQEFFEILGIDADGRELRAD